MDNNKLINIKNILYKKSLSNNSTAYNIVALGINKNGDILGTSTNKINCFKNGSKKGNGKHAERELIKKYGKSIKSIILYRKGNNDLGLPIHPCNVCQKICDKLNIKIYSIQQLFK